MHNQIVDLMGATYTYPVTRRTVRARRVRIPTRTRWFDRRTHRRRGMANLFANIGKRDLGETSLWLTDTIKGMLLMNTTTCDTEDDKATISAFTLLDENDGAGYTGGHAGADRLTVPSKTLVTDNPNTRAEGSGDPLVWTGLSAGARDLQGVLYFDENTSDADSVPIFFSQFTADIGLTGGDLTVNANAEGLYQLT